MKKIGLFGVVFSTLLSSALLAAPQPPRNMGERPEMHNSDRMKMDPVAQKMLEETHQRRREIMELVRDYKKASKEEQATIKADIIKKMNEDFSANLEARQKAIAKIEQKVAEMSEKTEERANDSEKFIDEMFEKLLKEDHDTDDNHPMMRGGRPEGGMPMMRGEHGENAERQGGNKPIMRGERGERGREMNKMYSEDDFIERPALDKDAVKEIRERRTAIKAKVAEYKAASEADQDAIKAEAIKLMSDDFAITLKNRQAMLAKAEKNLAKVKSDIAEKEENSAKLIEAEFEKLIKMDFTKRNRPQNSGNKPKR